MSVIVATASTTDVLNSVWGGVAVLAVIMVAIVGFLTRQITSVRTELRDDIAELRRDFGGRFDEVNRAVTSIDTKMQVAQAREDERERLVGWGPVVRVPARERRPGEGQLAEPEPERSE